MPSEQGNHFPSPNEQDPQSNVEGQAIDESPRTQQTDSDEYPAEPSENSTLPTIMTPRSNRDGGLAFLERTNHGFPAYGQPGEFQRFDGLGSPLSSRSSSVQSTTIPSRSFSMSILVQPPERCIVGVPLPTPIVVQVSQQALSSSIGRLMDQASGMYALLSVYSSDGSTMLAPGSRSNLVSLHSTLATVQVLLPIRTEQELGFLVYPNVVFREPGIFLLRFSLMDQNGPANRNAESSRTLADFPCVATRSIHVQQDGSQGTVDDEEQNILQTLRQRGLDV